jgi:hypothetical protein
MTFKLGFSNVFSYITDKSKIAILFCKAGCVKQKLHTEYPLINGKQIKELENEVQEEE